MRGLNEEDRNVSVDNFVTEKKSNVSLVIAHTLVLMLYLCCAAIQHPELISFDVIAYQTIQYTHAVRITSRWTLGHSSVITVVPWTIYSLTYGSIDHVVLVFQ